MTAMETARLIIRNFAISDWEALHAMVLQYESSEYAVYDRMWPTAADEVKKIAESFARGESYLAVCRKDTGRFIGFVALSQEQDPNCRAYELGYVFNSDHHGQGFATEACRAVIAHAFERLAADRVNTGTAAANQPSCRLLERLGLRKTAECTASFRNGPDGKPLEFLGYMYAVTKDEWRAAGRSR